MENCNLGPTLESRRAVTSLIPELSRRSKVDTIDVSSLQSALGVKLLGNVECDVGLGSVGKVVFEPQGDLIGNGKVLVEGGDVGCEGSGGVYRRAGVGGGNGLEGSRGGG